ncbi:MAG TPA: DUF305 domain-containing protein [Gemmatimonadaceae bacterium]|nr:DUF305 domain-containing protein [Gemmatimonadaceae bacterium]
MAATARVGRAICVVVAVAIAIATTIAACESQPRVPLSEVSLTGDTALSAAAAARADSEFVALMVPHHQHAIAMARVQLRFGRNYRLRRLAQEIIVTQQAEIAALRHALDSAAVSIDTTASLRGPR